MKIVSGDIKGQKLNVPKSIKIRPTTSKLRGSIFSILNSMNISLNNVLDLFAGTGSVGIEALSRGAISADFVEHSERLCSLLKKNLEKLNFTDRSRVYSCSVSKALGFLNKEYSVIFLDPPYSSLSTSSLIATITENPISKGATLIVQHPVKTVLLHRCNKFIIVKQKKYGETMLTIYKEEGY